jgi:hypothetical protein
LGALVSFLKVPFLEDPEVFRVHITNQAKSSASNRFDNLRKLLGCICIRRTKAVGYLDDPTVDLLYLELSPAEAQSYNGILRRYRARLEMAVSLRDNANASQHIFKAFHDLRLFCNNGSTRVAKGKSCIERDRIEAPRNFQVWQHEDVQDHAPFREDIPNPHEKSCQIPYQFAKGSLNTESASRIISSDNVDIDAIHKTVVPSKLCALLKRILEQPPSEKW